jgi:hypothetical protein
MLENRLIGGTHINGKEQKEEEALEEDTIRLDKQMLENRLNGGTHINGKDQKEEKEE